MGIDLDLECESLCQAGPRPKIVNPPFRSRSSVEERNTKGQSSSRSYQFQNSDGNFRELNLCDSQSPHRKSMPSRPPRLNAEDNVVQKRGSVYQTSSEVRRMRKLKEGRGKESAYSNEAFLSFDIVNSSSQGRRDDTILISQQKQSHLCSLNEEAKLPVDTTHSISKKATEFLDLSFHDLPENQVSLSSLCSRSSLLQNRSSENFLESNLNTNRPGIPGEKAAPDLVRKDSLEESEVKCSPKHCPQNDAITPYDRDVVHTLPKSVSAKVGMFSSSCHPERETLKSSPKTRFSPLKKMWDPILKSKSLRNPSLTEMETSKTAVCPASISRNGPLRKSLLNDFSKATEKMEYDKQLIVSDQSSSTGFSPAHLQAALKLEFSNGAPSFQFSIKDPEDILYAKTWRTDSAFNWAYTFHSSKQKNSSSGRSTKDRNGKSQMVGQMQVSCFLCSEESESGSRDNYMVTEFILYDIAQARRSFPVEERSHCSPDSIRPQRTNVSEGLAVDCPSESTSSVETEKYQNSNRQKFCDCASDPSTSYPWSPVDLHPHLEIAAIVVQIPLKKENLKDAQVVDVDHMDHRKVISCTALDRRRDTDYNCLDTAVVKVITPSGTHGLPNTGEGGPSSLLDRWRFDGGCDCGGWDMTCPIVVFDYPCAGDVVDYFPLGSQLPVLLFFQGRKEKVPALSVKSVGKGDYSVDFHAQLSSLQAFSICIAVLHSSEASAVGQERSKHRLHSNSLKTLLEEELKHLIEAVAEEKRKAKKRVEQISPSFILDPPFSPMGRV